MEKEMPRTRRPFTEQEQRLIDEFPKGSNIDSLTTEEKKIRQNVLSKVWKHKPENKQKEYGNNRYAKLKTDPVKYQKHLEERKEYRDKPDVKTRKKVTDKRNKDAWRASGGEAAYHKHKMETDPLYAIAKTIRNMNRRIFDLTGAKKDKSSKEYTGVEDWLELKEHLEKQFRHHPETGEMMSWENRGGEDGWQVDHIKPISRFEGLKLPEHTVEFKKAMKEVNHYKNLRPLWPCENYSKGNKLDEEWKKVK